MTIPKLVNAGSIISNCSYWLVFEIFRVVISMTLQCIHIHLIVMLSTLPVQIFGYCFSLQICSELNHIPRLYFNVFFSFCCTLFTNIFSCCIIMTHKADVN